MKNPYCAAALAVAAYGAAACVGVIGDPGGSSEATRPGVGAGQDAGVGISASPDGGQNGMCTGPALLTTSIAPTRRLTKREYASTVGSLLGVPVDVGSLPSGTAPNGFDTNDSTSVSSQHVQGYFSIAKTLATAVLASAQQRAALFACDPTGASIDTCLTSFITSFGLKAYRRPVTSDEISSLLALAHQAKQTGAYIGAQLVLEAMLQSPSLLYRPEFGVADSTHPGFGRLTGFEIATRLSYLLWGTSPDDSMLNAAQMGQLDTADAVVVKATAMFADAKAHPGMSNFYSQWLRFGSSASLVPDSNLFPSWTSTTASDFQTETSRLADDLIFRQGANFLDLVSAPYSFLNPALASFYGTSMPSGASGWTRVQYGSADHRGGLLRQGSFLAFTSHPGSASATRRGRYVREVLLCYPMPQPPPNVNTTLPPIAAGQSERDRIAAHESNPSCAGCHSLMDPVGFGLLQYDAIGQFNASDSHQQAYDVTGTISGIPNGGAFNGPAELEQKIHDSDAFARCVAVQTFRFAMGRAETTNDACTIDAFQTAFRNGGYGFSGLVAALVQSDVFRYMPAGGGP